jgi:hypothetical protein
VNFERIEDCECNRMQKLNFSSYEDLESKNIENCDTKKNKVPGHGYLDPIRKKSSS